MDQDLLPTNRLEAAKLRSLFYQSSPCSKGHSGLRYTTSGNCVECNRAASLARHELVRKLLRGETA